MNDNEWSWMNSHIMRLGDPVLPNEIEIYGSGYWEQKDGYEKEQNYNANQTKQRERKTGRRTV